MKIEITKAQLNALWNMKEYMKTMLGGAEDDSEWIHNIRLIERMLEKNNYIEPHNLNLTPNKKIIVGY